MTKFFIAATVAAAALISTPLSAKDHSWQIGNDAFHVYYRDLNMSKAADRAEMLARVETAATRLCRDRTSLQIDLQNCITDIVAQAAPRSPMLRLAMAERQSLRYAAR